MSAWGQRLNWMLGLLLAATSATAFAQPDFPGRAGRVAELQGEVQLLERDERRWEPAYLNRALSSGDRLRTGEASHLTLRVGSTVVRLGPDSELELERVDDEALHFGLRLGHLALRVRSPEVADEIVVHTPEVRLRPLQPGHYRVDRAGEATQAGVWEGEWLLVGSLSFPIGRGERREFWFERGSSALAHRAIPLRADSFAAWVLAEDARDPALAAGGPVSPEMTGAEELQRHGRWESHPEYGLAWVPMGVPPGWAPFRDGRWAWVSPWGWTWVDAQPWAFVTSHYGRWVQWGVRWVWLPGAYVARPAFAPALVAWVGGGAGISVGVRVLPGSNWVPLAPWDVWTPWFPAAPRYVDRVHAPWPRDRRPPPPVRVVPSPSGPPIMQRPPAPHGVPDPRMSPPPREMFRAPPAPVPMPHEQPAPIRRAPPAQEPGEERMRPPRDLRPNPPSGPPTMSPPSPATITPPVPAIVRPAPPPVMTPPPAPAPTHAPPTIRPAPSPATPPGMAPTPRPRSPDRDADAEERRKQAPEPRGPGRDRRQQE